MPYNKVVLTQLAVWSYFLMEREKHSYSQYWVCWGVYPAWRPHLSWCGGRENCREALAPTACGPLVRWIYLPRYRMELTRTSPSYLQSLCRNRNINVNICAYINTGNVYINENKNESFCFPEKGLSLHHSFCKAHSTDFSHN